MMFRETVLRNRIKPAATENALNLNRQNVYFIFLYIVGWEIIIIIIRALKHIFPGDEELVDV